MLVLLLAGCAPTRGAAYERSLALAEEAQRAHRDAEAAALYEQAAGAAKVPRDGAHARYLRAMALERAGDASAARAAYEAIASAAPPQEDSAEAAYREADLAIRTGDPEVGWRGLEEVVRRFPAAGVARPALHRLVRHLDEERGDAGTLESLRGLEPALEATDAGEEIAYEIAARLARLGQAEAARAAFVHVAERWPYPGGTLFDDALYRASELDEQLGRYDAAIEDLRGMLASRESSLIVGSYERPRYDAAQLRMGELYRDRLHDPARARAAFHALYASFKTSSLRDRGLWEEAELWGTDGADGRARACDVLATLVLALPDSRYVACAIERCPRLTVPKASHAPRECHAYIEREAGSAPAP